LYLLEFNFTMNYLERAIADGHAKLTGEGKQQKILYVAVNHTERYADPEEQVRAEFWAELIYRYGYEPARIGVEPELRNKNGWHRRPACAVRPLAGRKGRDTGTESRRAKKFKRFPRSERRVAARHRPVACATFRKPEEYRFHKGDPNNDIQPVSKEALIGAIKKCHQTLWAGGKLSANFSV